MKLSENAIRVLKKRYFKKDEEGQVVEDWKSMLTRVAKNISDGNSEKQEVYFNLLNSGKFLPNSPTLMNAGNELQQLSACFVLPIEDSMDSIFESLKNAALIHKSGGGTGFSFSRLREANAQVKTTNGVSSGPISFLKVYNAATDAVKQGGTRRGANMAIINVTHPDILEFITSKENLDELTNFNISVGLNDNFMHAVIHNEEYDLISPHTKEKVKSLEARAVFNLIVDMAHKNGEPGIIFIDRINKFNPTPHIGEIESTNPCGEQPLLPNEACNLGSINVKAFIEGNSINWNDLKQTVYDSVEFLDDVISKSRFPLSEIDEMVKANRKIGLGLMGWADLLYILKIPYNSDKAVELARELMEFIDYHAKLKSIELAADKGAFPNFKGSIYDKGNLERKGKLKWKDLINKMKDQGVRNATVTTIAPTGTISMIADTSSGIEPQFSLVYVKNVMDGDKLLYINPYFEEAIKNAGIYSKELMELVSEVGSIQNLEQIPIDIRKVFVTSHDISPEWHIKMQSAFQHFVDNAVSKTINFNHDASREDIYKSYELAYELGCKGVTVYRDGSRQNQVLNVGKKVKDQENPEERISPRNRPVITTGMTHRIETGCGHMYVTINSDDHGVCELFTQMGKVGGCASAQLEAIARLSSLSMRSYVKVESIIHQLKGIRCPSPMWNKGKMVTSCADAVAQALETYLAYNNDNEIKKIKIHPPQSQAEIKSSARVSIATCPDCGGVVEHTEGCMKCVSCGWSKC